MYKIFFWRTKQRQEWERKLNLRVQIRMSFRSMTQKKTRKRMFRRIFTQPIPSKWIQTTSLSRINKFRSVDSDQSKNVFFSLRHFSSGRNPAQKIPRAHLSRITKRLTVVRRHRPCHFVLLKWISQLKYVLSRASASFDFYPRLVPKLFFQKWYEYFESARRKRYNRSTARRLYETIMITARLGTQNK